VISGNVITKFLFSLREDKPIDFIITFYAKRIRRLMPALFFVVIATLIFVLVVVTGAFEAIGNTGAYALIGLSNMSLWHLSTD